MNTPPDAAKFLLPVRPPRVSAVTVVWSPAVAVPPRRCRSVCRGAVLHGQAVAGGGVPALTVVPAGVGVAGAERQRFRSLP